MLTIRLNRVGKKNQAQFRIVLQEHTTAPGGRHIEVLGSYNPHSKELSLNEEKITYWISKGAQPSDTVHNMLVNKGVIKEAKRKVKLPEKKKEAETENTDKEEKAAPADAKEEKPEEAPQAEVKEETPVEAGKKEEIADKNEESAPEKKEEEAKPEEAK